MAITYRLVKGTALTYAELDDNFTTLVTSLATATSHLLSLDNEVALLQSEVTALQGKLAVQPALTTVSVGAVSGTATLVPSLSAANVLLLKILTTVNPTDVYDLEIYDGTVAGGVRIFLAQNVTGNYFNNSVSFSELTNTNLDVRVVNKRGDAAPFSLSLSVKLMWA